MRTKFGHELSLGTAIGVAAKLKRLKLGAKQRIVPRREAAVLLLDKRSRKILDKLWMLMVEEGGSPVVTFPTYALLHIRISNSLAPAMDRDEANTVAAEDFEHDADGGDSLSAALFDASMIELADMWVSENIKGPRSADAIPKFYERLFENCAEPDGKGGLRFKQLETVRLGRTPRVAHQSVGAPCPGVPRGVGALTSMPPHR